MNQIGHHIVYFFMKLIIDWVRERFLHCSTLTLSPVAYTVGHGKTFRNTMYHVNIQFMSHVVVMKPLNIKKSSVSTLNLLEPAIMVFNCQSVLWHILPPSVSEFKSLFLILGVLPNDTQPAWKWMSSGEALE